MNGHVKPRVHGSKNENGWGWHWSVILGNEVYWFDRWKDAHSFVQFVVDKEGYLRHGVAELYRNSSHLG